MVNRFDTLPHIARRYSKRKALYAGTGLWPQTTLKESFFAKLRAHPEQRWTFSLDGAVTQLTLGELGTEAIEFGHAVLSSDAHTVDDTIAIVLPNSPGAFSAFFGAQLAGLTAFPTSMREGRDSLAELFGRVGISHVVVAEGDEQRAEWVLDLIREGSVSSLWYADGAGHIRPHAPLEIDYSQEFPLTEDGVHLIAYTSGSTSEPKIVLHTDAELLAESHSLTEVFGCFGTMLVAAPVGHITGILHLLTVPLVRDGDIVSMDRWNAELAVKLCREFGAETLAGTSLYFQAMQVVDPELGGIKGGIAGGGPVAPIIVESVYRTSGVRLVRSYGSTEHPTITQSHPDDPLEVRALTDGSLNAGVEARFVDPEGNDVPVGVAGEILSRGPDAMAGYLEPELDAEFYDEDGWFRTSDVGILDESGNVTLTDRIKDLIIRGGENISAKEVEDIIHRWDVIVEVSVVGVPDVAYGERACAFVQTAEPVTLESLRDYLAETRLEKFKWPEFVQIVDDFPRTPSGKVRKQSLRELWVQSEFQVTSG
ncbi:MAG: AMP-dependent synthetase and ligase [Subtercola sp.]|nr:AMP-dependent synthetase and ligase [Subtercola sp.]